jgi:hypothetical protein
MNVRLPNKLVTSISHRMKQKWRRRSADNPQLVTLPPRFESTPKVTSIQNKERPRVSLHAHKMLDLDSQFLISTRLASLQGSLKLHEGSCPLVGGILTALQQAKSQLDLLELSPARQSSLSQRIRSEKIESFEKVAEFFHHPIPSLF